MSKRDFYRLWLIIFIVLYLLSILSISIYYLPEIISLTREINALNRAISTVDSGKSLATGESFTEEEKANIVGNAWVAIFKYKPERSILIRNYIITFLLNPIWIGIAVFGVLLVKTKRKGNSDNEQSI